MAVTTRRFFAALRMSPIVAAMLCPQPTAAQLPGQSFTVTADTGASTVGDSVTLRFRIRLHERDQPLDSIPRVVGALPPGVRVLSVEKLSRSPGRLYDGSAKVAFYRPGRRPVPVFGLPFMRIVEGVSRATLPSDSAFVEVRAVLPGAGNPALKDIKELEERPMSLQRWLALAAALIAATGLYLRFRRKNSAETLVVEPEPTTELMAPSAYDVALERLNRVEEEHWPDRGRVALHYEGVAQTLRQYLEDAHEIGALERTTSELMWAMPPHLGKGGLRDRCQEILTEADLVKFAEVRPSEAAASDFLARARHLLGAWHASSPLTEGAHAIR